MMTIGMLWFDNDKATSLEQKVITAASYYQGKYGQVPTQCIVHPDMLKEPCSKTCGIDVQQNASIRPNHFWIG
ncbi:MAG: hypothetical protein JXA19_02515 [Anaerolineales bacterium]|nr:hypothetical protein [Anaerolineales bacterium]